MSEDSYDTNKYQFGIHKYLRNPNTLPAYTDHPYPTPPQSVSSSSTDTNDFNEKAHLQRLYQQQQEAATMGGNSPRYSLLPRVSTSSSDNPEQRGFMSSNSKKHRSCSIKFSTIRTLIRLMTLIILILAITLILIFFRNPYMTAVVFLFINLAENIPILVLQATQSTSPIAFRIRIELKKNDWKRNAAIVAEMGDSGSAQRGAGNVNKVKGTGKSCGIAILDVLAGIGTMIGAIVIAATTGSAWCIFPFTIMGLQFVLAICGMFDGKTVFKLIVKKAKDDDDSEEDLLPSHNVRDEYRDLEHEAGASAPMVENVVGGN